ncbi:Trypsin [Actinobacteria bacterium OK074]|nr:Trypsin [Actinobacteria bacterium OK074]
MDTSTSDGGRHRRRFRIALPLAAAGIAAAAPAALLTSSAQAATPQPTPTVTPANTAPTLAALKARIKGAIATDGTAGETAKSSMSASTSSSSAISPKIIGGTETTITTAPWMAQLWYYDDKGTTTTADDVGFFCGGTVVSPTKILTAAHCVKGYNWKANGAVVTGTADLADDDLHGGTASGVWYQWNHPSYNAATIDNDVAILTLANPITAKPIPMTTTADTASYKAGTSATVYGWGRTSGSTEDIAQTLKTATLPIQSDANCAAEYGTGYIKGHMVCAGDPATGSDDGTTAICNGDSGGPLIVGGKVVGVVSYNTENCGAVPGEEGAYSGFAKLSTYAGLTHQRVEDTDLSGDGRADVFFRNKAQQVGYELDSKGTSFGGRQSWGDWSGVNVIAQADLDRDGYQDFVYRVSAGGDVYWLHWVPASGSWATKKLYDDWKTRKRIITPGDLTGDGLPDLASVDSGGTLWIYPGKGNGSFGTRAKVGTGWNQYNVVVGHGDFNDDGHADLIARSSGGNNIWLYRGTGKTGTAAFSARVKVRTAWNSVNAVDAVGDITGDGKADLLARTTDGTLWLYKGTGKASSAIFATRVKIGTNFAQYDILG